MSRRASEGSLFVGRLGKSTRVRDLEDIFEPYGRMTRCEIKYAYAFIDYEDHRDAEDAVRYENGREICGSSIIVERAKGAPRRSLAPRSSAYDDSYRYGRSSRDNYPDRYDRRSGPRGGRYRSPSPRRRRSRSRSRDRRRHSRSRSRSKRRRRSSSVSPRRSSKRSRSTSPSKSKSRSRSPQSKSGSGSPPRNGQQNDKSPSRSPVDD
ncbi:probable splicing factor, arginine/serine-rich 5 isoform X2 [Ostrea edulis]|uniref:probable splicing factor, arginine/serine-rich 5 isoform X2 n=1 Tax=Ostrea edulis TaxID=37623 RepID=UPI0024AE9136|nr:probable splicing factor, arginine/serine-rich 5 isoform X2 [Ostrea edulis]